MVNSEHIVKFISLSWSVNFKISFFIQSEGPSFISDFVERVVPFVAQLEKLWSGTGRQCLTEYMVSTAKVKKRKFYVAIYWILLVLLCMSIYAYLVG